MNAQRRILGLALLSALLIGASYSRTFTNADGRKMEGEMISATETHVVLKSLKNGKSYTIEILTLSGEDQKFIAERAVELSKGVAELAAQRNIAEFAETNLGKKVGNGECWTLADHAYKKARIKRPGKDLRVWGRVVDWENEDFLPGDILELKAASFTNGSKSGPEHTAVVKEKGRRKGAMMVYHQNWGRPGKIVSLKEFDLNELTAGEAIVYRYETVAP